MNIQNKNSLSLYVHWPYCESKCPYCDFNSHIIETIDLDQWIQSYVNQLYKMREQLIKFDVKFDKLDTIFFGGGTPSLMPLSIIEKILSVSSKLFKFEDNIEITLEANPSSYEIKKFKDLKKLGINRLSIGVQSLNDKNLKFLGRTHRYKDSENAIESATKNFENISVDIIYGLYGQNIEDWTVELENFLKKFNLHHLSLYQLNIEEGTKFFTDYKKGLLKTIDTDLAADFYDVTNQILTNKEYYRYEISNYSKRGFESKHNLNYWRSANWIGIGPGAYGRLWSLSSKNKRIEFQNYKNPKTWLNKNSHKSDFEKIKFFDNYEIDTDTLIMGLRLNGGIEISKLINKSFIKNKKFSELQEKNFITIDDKIIKVNDDYMIKLNSIINFLID